MTASIREVAEGLQVVGLAERIPFGLDVTNWGSSPTSVTVVSEKYDMDTKEYTVNTTTVFPSGSASVAGNIITLPVLVPQAVGDVYRIGIGFTCSGKGLQAFAWIKVEK